MKLTDEQVVAKIDALWKIHGEEFLREFITEHPGERPDVWWRLNSPEPRPEIQYTILPPPASYAESVDRSISGEPYNSDLRRQRVREIAVLIRHNLLTTAEQEAIRAKDAADAALRAAGPGAGEEVR